MDMYQQQLWSETSIYCRGDRLSAEDTLESWDLHWNVSHFICLLDMQDYFKII